jgi:hypothetical protein
MTATDHDLIIAVARSASEWMGVRVLALGVERGAVVLLFVGPLGERRAWANFDGVTAGGMGRIAGTLAQGCRRVARGLI